MFWTGAKGKLWYRRSDASKVAGGKFWRVGDRRNREYCERTRTRRPCFKETIAKYPDFDFGWLVLGLAVANSRLNRKVARYFCCGRKEKLIWVGGIQSKIMAWRDIFKEMWADGNLEIYPKCFCARKIWNFEILSETILFSANSFLYAKKQLPTKLPRSMKHITYCLPKSEPVFL